jgi:hypothetical protein
MRELLEEWRVKYQSIFTVVYCVGSRWTNVHMGFKTKGEYIPPPPPAGFAEIADHAELVREKKPKLK